MRKAISMILFSCLITVLFGCAGSTVQPSFSNDEVEGIKEQIFNINTSYVYYDSLEDYLKYTDHVVIAKVKKILPVERINLRDIVVTSMDKSWVNITPVNIEIVSSIVGDLTDGDEFELRLMGGLFIGKTEKNMFECITEIYDQKNLAEDKTYILFINSKFQKENDLKYPYILSSPIYGWIEKKDDGKIAIDYRNDIIDPNLMFDEISDLIRK